MSELTTTLTLTDSEIKNIISSELRRRTGANIGTVSLVVHHGQRGDDTVSACVQIKVKDKDSPPSRGIDICHLK